MGKETKVGVCQVQVPLEHFDGLAKFGRTSETTHTLIAAASTGFLRHNQYSMGVGERTVLTRDNLVDALQLEDIT